MHGIVKLVVIALLLAILVGVVAGVTVGYGGPAFVITLVIVLLAGLARVDNRLY